MLYRNFDTGEADGGVLNLWSLGDEVLRVKMRRIGRSGLEGVSTEASGDRFKTCGVASTPLCGGKNYDLSCLNFASAKTTKSGNIGCSCIMPRTISRKAITHHYADLRGAPRAGGQSGGKALERCSDI